MHTPMPLMSYKMEASTEHPNPTSDSGPYSNHDSGPFNIQHISTKNMQQNYQKSQYIKTETDQSMVERPL